MSGDDSHVRAFDLRREHVSLDDHGADWPLEITPQFWSEVLAGKRRLGRWMLGANHRTKDPTLWDLHPNGECIAALLTGSIDIVVADAYGAERVVELRDPGDSVVVPRGVWHRQIVHEPSDLLFLTAGEGTEQRPVDE